MRNWPRLRRIPDGNVCDGGRVQGIVLLGLGFLFFSMLLLGCGGSADPVASNSGSSPSSGISAAILDAIKADMGLNEAPPLDPVAGTAWVTRAFITMGSVPRGDALPSWFHPTTLGTALVPLGYWNAVTPWFVITPGAANAATNVRVKISEITLYFFSRSQNVWEKVTPNGALNPTWAYRAACHGYGRVGSITPRVEPDGRLSYKVDNTAGCVHGGMLKYPINAVLSAGAADIGGVFATMRSELVVDDPLLPDDRAVAQILTSLGTDYYPSINSTTADFPPQNYAPASGASRYGIVSATPRTHYLATLDVPAVPLPNPPSPYVAAGGSLTMSVAQFEANPPPGL